MDKVLLLDGLNLIKRGNVKFKPSSNKYSFTIIYNFFRSLKATIDTFKPTKVFFCLEGKSNFRYSIFPEYKANRIIKKASKNNEDDDLQRDVIIKLLAHLPITLVHADNYEADDVIGTLSETLNDEEVIIISTDSDFIQLLQRGLNVKLFNPATKKFVESPDFHYLGWKILRGDKATDNIPSLVGDKEAIKLVKHPELLEQFLSVEENKANLNLNRQLIEIRSIPDEEIILKSGSKDLALLKDEFMKMDFKSMLTDKYWTAFEEVFNSL